MECRSTSRRRRSSSSSSRRRSTRRSFLRRAATGGISLASVLHLFRSHAALAQSDDDTRPPSYPSHGPGRRWLRESRELIEQIIMPPPRVRRADEQILVSSRLENVFFLRMGQRAVLVDTGFHHQVDRHLDNFAKMGCDLSQIVAILATHSHVDHTAGLKRARDRLNVPIVAHANAVKPITTGDLLQTAAVIPELAGWEFDYPACEIDETVDDGDEILIGQERITVRHLPGHTPDCLGYLWRQRFFTGDAVFGGGGIGWANARWFSNYADHADTMQRLKDEPIDAERFFAAHGGGLPYSEKVPTACLTKLDSLLARENDPCNHTPRITPRAQKRPVRTLRLAAR